MGGQEIHQEAVKLSAGCVEELAGNLARHQLGSPESHWEDASRGEGAVKLSRKLPRAPTEGSKKVPVGALLHRKLSMKTPAECHQHSLGWALSRVCTPTSTTETKGSKACQDKEESPFLLQCSFREKIMFLYHTGQGRRDSELRSTEWMIGVLGLHRRSSQGPFPLMIWALDVTLPQLCT